jgi:penicillin-insensitive murein endopeptidase
MDMKLNQPMERTFLYYALRRRSLTRYPANKVCSPLASIFVAAFLVVSTYLPAWAKSTCYGTPSKGRIEVGVQLPESGSNFSAYTSLGVSLGRTYVHEQVRYIVVAAYSAVAYAVPEKVFVYGETGWKSGGRLRPHRTHENGLSVDFFVPVTDSLGKSISFPISLLNKFGYGIDFDAEGKFEDLAIDFEAIGEHVYQLNVAAQKANAPIALVIFDPQYLPKLFATKHGDFLQHSINFMKGKAWIRHDEHYHIDFGVPCKPFAG